MKPKYDSHEKESDHQLESERFLCEMEAEFLIHELKAPLAVIESGMELLLKIDRRQSSVSQFSHQLALSLKIRSRKSLKTFKTLILMLKSTF